MLLFPAERSGIRGASDWWNWRRAMAVNVRSRARSASKTNYPNRAKDQAAHTSSARGAYWLLQRADKRDDCSVEVEKADFARLFKRHFELLSRQTSKQGHKNFQIKARARNVKGNVRRRRSFRKQWLRNFRAHKPSTEETSDQPSRSASWQPVEMAVRASACFANSWRVSPDGDAADNERLGNKRLDEQHGNATAPGWNIKQSISC